MLEYRNEVLIFDLLDWFWIHWVVFCISVRDDKWGEVVSLDIWVEMVCRSVFGVVLEVEVEGMDNGPIAQRRAFGKYSSPSQRFNLFRRFIGVKKSDEVISVLR